MRLVWVKRSYNVILTSDEDNINVVEKLTQNSTKFVEIWCGLDSFSVHEDEWEWCKHKDTLKNGDVLTNSQDKGGLSGRPFSSSGPIAWQEGPRTLHSEVVWSPSKRMGYISAYYCFLHFLSGWSLNPIRCLAVFWLKPNFYLISLLGFVILVYFSLLLCFNL